MGRKLISINPNPFRTFQADGSDSSYHIYEKGKDKVLISKGGKMHVWLTSHKGDIAFYLWDGKKWQPKLKWDGQKFDEILKTEEDIINFFKQHQQLW